MYNFKVRCIDDSGKGFTKGEIYEVKDGRLTNDDGEVVVSTFDSFEELNDKFISKFVQVDENEMEYGYTDITHFSTYNLEDVVNLLLNSKPKKVAFRFNGNWLYSDTVTMDSAFLEICGSKYYEYNLKIEKEREENKKRNERESELAIMKIPFIYQRAKNLIKKEKLEDFRKLMLARISDIYHGMELENALDILEALKNEDTEKAEKSFEEAGHSGMSASLTKIIVNRFLEDEKSFM